MKEHMRLNVTLEMEIDVLPFPEPLPIPELLAEYDLKQRAVAALMQSSELTSILMYVAFQDENLLRQIASSLRIPTLPFLHVAAEQIGDDELAEFASPQGDRATSRHAVSLFKAAMSRFRIASAKIADPTIRHGHLSTTSRSIS